jgi:hypothetical protein
MSSPLLIFGVSLVAFAIWLTVRIVNNRERWAKRTMLGMAAVVIGYPASFGPACWIADREIIPKSLIRNLYEPLGTVVVSCPSPFRTMMFRYGDVGTPDDRLPLCTSRLLFLNEMLRRQRAGDSEFSPPAETPDDRPD